MRLAGEPGPATHIAAPALRTAQSLLNAGHLPGPLPALAEHGDLKRFDDDGTSAGPAVHPQPIAMPVVIADRVEALGRHSSLVP